MCCEAAAFIILFYFFLASFHFVEFPRVHFCFCFIFLVINASFFLHHYSGLLTGFFNIPFTLFPVPSSIICPLCGDATQHQPIRIRHELAQNTPARSDTVSTICDDIAKQKLKGLYQP